MGAVEKFEDLEVWKRSRKLSKRLHELTEKDPFESDFSLRDQSRRAVNSICLNIAEGFGRSSRGDFIRFLDYGRASVTEVQATLHLAVDRNYISDKEYRDLYAELEEIGKMISGLIKYLQSLDD